MGDLGHKLRDFRVVCAAVLTILALPPKHLHADDTHALIARNISDAELDLAVRQNGTSIRSVTLTSPKLTDPAWGRLAKCLNIRRFQVTLNHTLTDNTLRFLGSLPRLESIELNYCSGVTGEFLKSANKWPELKSVEIRNRTFDGSNLVHIRGNKLTWLEITVGRSARRIWQHSGHCLN